MIDGCPIHSTRHHTFDQCPHPDAHSERSLRQYLWNGRIGKPMIASRHNAFFECNRRDSPNLRPLLPDEVRSIIDHIANWDTYSYPIDPYDSASIWQFVEWLSEEEKEEEEQQQESDDGNNDNDNDVILRSESPIRSQSQLHDNRLTKYRRQRRDASNEEDGNDVQDAHGNEYSSSGMNSVTAAEKTSLEGTSQQNFARFSFPFGQGLKHSFGDPLPPLSRNNGQNFSGGVGSSSQLRYHDLEMISHFTATPSKEQEHENMVRIWAAKHGAPSFPKSTPAPMLTPTTMPAPAPVLVEVPRHEKDPEWVFEIEDKIPATIYATAAERIFVKEIKESGIRRYQYSLLATLSGVAGSYDDYGDEVMMAEAPESAGDLNDGSTTAILREASAIACNERLVMALRQYAAERHQPLEAMDILHQVHVLASGLEKAKYNAGPSMPSPVDLFAKAIFGDLTTLKVCVNCRQYGHTNTCPNPCFLCKTKDHPNARCQLACPCTYFAGHIKVQCTLPCLQCVEGDPDYNKDHPHRAMHCSKYCAICPDIHNVVEVATLVKAFDVLAKLILAGIITWWATCATHALSRIAKVMKRMHIGLTALSVVVLTTISICARIRYTWRKLIMYQDS